jgi:hypothetical protein
MIVLAAIWAIAEYRNEGGWPTNGFSQSSGSPKPDEYAGVSPFGGQRSPSAGDVVVSDSSGGG